MSNQPVSQQEFDRLIELDALQRPLTDTEEREATAIYEALTREQGIAYNRILLEIEYE